MAFVSCLEARFFGIAVNRLYQDFYRRYADHACSFCVVKVGGFSSRELIRLLRSMKGLNIISGDVVEVAPAYDHAGESAGIHSWRGGDHTCPS